MLDWRDAPAVTAARSTDAKGGTRHGAVLPRRIIGPRRDRPVRFELPPLQSAADLKAAMEASPPPSRRAS